MRIAIVDDDPTLRISLNHFLKKWLANNLIEYTINEYNSGLEFLDACKADSFDIVFMDIFMEKMDGIETATQMRVSNKDTILVFLTSSTDHMPDAFSVHAFGYLLKPLLPDKLFKVMDDVKALQNDDGPCLEVAVGRVNLYPKYSEIVYIQSDSNYCIIHCRDEIKSRGPFSVLCQPLLDSEDFCMINRGILVNLAHVTKMEELECFMDNGDILPLNTKKAPGIRQDYQTYKFNHS